jgi:hypothetical protein
MRKIDLGCIFVIGFFISIFIVAIVAVVLDNNRIKANIEKAGCKLLLEKYKESGYINTQYFDAYNNCMKINHR